MCGRNVKQIVGNLLLVLAFIGCMVLEGCASTGSIPTQIVEQSAEVDTSISQLQTQQTDSSAAVQAVSDTADAIEQTAATVKNDTLTKQITTLKTQVKTLSGSLAAERSTTAEISEEYNNLKVTAGTSLVNASVQINKLTAQVKLARKWVWILGGTLAALLLVSAGFAVIKFYFKK